MHPSPPLPPFPHLPPPLTGAPAGVPVGSIIAFAGLADPNTAGAALLAAQGWRVCDGTALSTTQYNELFTVIGYQWSPQDGGDTFCIPNLRGYFLRGVDGGSGNDPDAGSRILPDKTVAPQVGSLQHCALQDHVHSYKPAVVSDAPEGGEGGSVTTGSSDTERVVVKGDPPSPRVSDAETRPVNVYVYYLIKFTSQVFPPFLHQAQRWGSEVDTPLAGCVPVERGAALPSRRASRRCDGCQAAMTADVPPP